jgi:WD40 repeat protein
MSESKLLFLQIIHFKFDLTLKTISSKLYVGTSAGSIRVYSWPPTVASNIANNSTSTSANGIFLTLFIILFLFYPYLVANTTNMHPMFYELSTHGGPVIAIKISPLNNTLISAASDGTIFIHSLVIDESKKTQV